VPEFSSSSALQRWQQLVDKKPIGSRIHFRGITYMVHIRDCGSRYTVLVPKAA
jgi:hypothetical protein